MDEEFASCDAGYYELYRPEMLVLTQKLKILQYMELLGANFIQLCQTGFVRRGKRVTA